MRKEGYHHRSVSPFKMTCYRQRQTDLSPMQYIAKQTWAQHTSLSSGEFPPHFWMTKTKTEKKAPIFAAQKNIRFLYIAPWEYRFFIFRRDLMRVLRQYFPLQTITCVFHQIWQSKSGSRQHTVFVNFTFHFQIGWTEGVAEKGAGSPWFEHIGMVFISCENLVSVTH